jgi:hypothetical protein
VSHYTLGGVGIAECMRLNVRHKAVARSNWIEYRSICEIPRWRALLRCANSSITWMDGAQREHQRLAAADKRELKIA